MFHIVLVEPEIPPNTGNVIRLSANTGCTLHLIEPLGFSMEDRLMRRAGLDYHEYTQVQRHPGWTAHVWSNWWKRFFNAKVLPAQNRQRLDADNTCLSKVTVQSFLYR